MAVITKGIQLWYKGNNVNMKPTFSAGAVEDSTYGYLVPDLQEIGDITAAEGAERDKIEITTLADDKHVYTDGLITDGESDGIEFKLLYSHDVYAAFLSIANVDKVDEQYSEYYVTIPAGVDKRAQFYIKGRTKIKLDGAGVNSALTMTLTITPIDAIAFQPSVEVTAE